MSSPRSLNVAVVGAPNSGKSTLVNYLTKHKVSAVSPKYNTTRDRILGIYTSGSTQLVFSDTPGFVPSTGGSGRFVASLVTAAAESIPMSDVVLFVVDVARRWDDEQEASLTNVAELCAKAQAGLFLVANKIDLLRGTNVSKERIAALQGELAKLRVDGSSRTRQRAALPHHVDWDAKPLDESPTARPAPAADVAPTMRVEVAPTAGKVPSSALSMKVEILTDVFETKCFQAGLVGPEGFDTSGPHPPTALSHMYQFLKPVHQVCAASGEGVDTLRDALVRLAIPREWEYGKDMVTDRSALERAMEIIREKVFLHLHHEVPHQVRQLNRSWRRNAAGDLVIEHDLVVPRQTVANMLLARSRGPLKAISMSSIQDLEREFGCKVHLFLHVSVKKDQRVLVNPDHAGSHV